MASSPQPPSSDETELTTDASQNPTPEKLPKLKRGLARLFGSLGVLLAILFFGFFALALDVFEGLFTPYSAVKDTRLITYPVFFVDAESNINMEFIAGSSVAYRCNDEQIQVINMPRESFPTGTGYICKADSSISNPTAAAMLEIVDAYWVERASEIRVSAFQSLGLITLVAGIIFIVFRGFGWLIWWVASGFR